MFRMPEYFRALLLVLHCPHNVSANNFYPIATSRHKNVHYKTETEPAYLRRWPFEYLPDSKAQRRSFSKAHPGYVSMKLVAKCH